MRIEVDHGEVVFCSGLLACDGRSQLTFAATGVYDWTGQNAACSRLPWVNEPI